MAAYRARVLVLDDENYRIELIRELLEPAEIVGATDCAAFLTLAREGSWSLLCLDHDLGGGLQAPTSLPAVEAIARPEGELFRSLCHVPVLVHSLNLHAASSIVAALWAWEAPVLRLPFHLLGEYASLLRELADV